MSRFDVPSLPMIGADTPELAKRMDAELLAARHPRFVLAGRIAAIVFLLVLFSAVAGLAVFFWLWVAK